MPTHKPSKVQPSEVPRNAYVICACDNVLWRIQLDWDAGFEDAQTSSMARGFLPGYTCCFHPHLRTGGLLERIDYVMARGTQGLVNVVNFAITGDLETDETVTGLRPSDHVGVFARVEFVRR